MFGPGEVFHSLPTANSWQLVMLVKQEKLRPGLEEPKLICEVWSASSKTESATGQRQGSEGQVGQVELCTNVIFHFYILWPNFCIQLFIALYLAVGNACFEF